MAVVVARRGRFDAQRLVRSIDKPLDALGALHEAEEAVQGELEAQVRLARAEGRSWTEIGDALGITRQGARQRYRHVEAGIDPDAEQPPIQWPTSGYVVESGIAVAVETSEAPAGGDSTSSLPGFLSGSMPDRFFLSPRAAARILRRAGRRRRKVLESLELTLRERADQGPQSESEDD